MAGKFCVECGKQIGFYNRYGNVTSIDKNEPRGYNALTIYCSNACKQKSYRQRLKKDVTKASPGEP